MSDDRFFHDTQDPAAKGLRYACLAPSPFIDDLNIGLLAIEASRRLGVPIETAAPVVCGLLADFIQQRESRYRSGSPFDARDANAERNSENRQRQISLLRNAAAQQRAA